MRERDLFSNPGPEKVSASITKILDCIFFARLGLHIADASPGLASWSLIQIFFGKVVVFLIPCGRSFDLPNRQEDLFKLLFIPCCKYIIFYFGST